jgi:hypothetical protein
MRGLRRGQCGCRGRGERVLTGKKGDTNMWVICAMRRQNRAPRSTLGSYRVLGECPCVATGVKRLV